MAIVAASTLARFISAVARSMFVVVDGVEEVFDLADRGQLFEHERAFKVALVHAVCLRVRPRASVRAEA